MFHKLHIALAIGELSYVIVNYGISNLNPFHYCIACLIIVNIFKMVR